MNWCIRIYLLSVILQLVSAHLNLVRIEKYHYRTGFLTNAGGGTPSNSQSLFLNGLN